MQQNISDNDNLESLSASISAAASNTSTSIKDRFIFSYEEKPIIYTGTKNFPILQEKPNGEKVLWNSTKEAANALDVKTLYIMRVINGERKSFKGCKWSDARLKQGELLGTPMSQDNQQPSLNSNVLEGSTTNIRVLPGNAGDSNDNTSALPKV